MQKEKLTALLLLITVPKSNGNLSNRCECYNETILSNVVYEPMINCYCANIHENVLSTIAHKVNILSITKSDIEVIKSNMFSQFEETLTDISLKHLNKLKIIENGALSNCRKLLSVSITYAPLLHNVPLKILESYTDKLKVVRITKTGLRHIPKIRMKRNHILHIIDFEGNELSILKTDGIEVEADHVIFDYNKIETIEDWAFNNSKISKLSFKGNQKLRTLSDNSFRGLGSLQVLDLSETKISCIPTYGIREIEILIIKNTPSLSVIPSIYDFGNLKEAHLTHSYHCCAFQLPERHDPQRHAAHQIYIEHTRAVCKYFNVFGISNNVKASTPVEEFVNDELENDEDQLWHDLNNGTEVTNEWPNETEEFHQEPLNIKDKKLLAMCGSFYIKNDPVRCNPQPNAFNPCEDIMGYHWLRISVWFVCITAFIGNLSVLAVILNKPKEMSTQSFLIVNLALSDLCMALFLFLLAYQDFISKGYYFNFAFHWQEGNGCKIAGAITIFASQLSIFVLCLLTLERWYSIKRALHINKLNFPLVIAITAFGWIYAIIMATLPLYGVSSYSKTSLCLPMSMDKSSDVIYILLLLSNGIAAFILICVCYFQIYFSLSYETRNKDGEYRLARKITVLVITNFICWAPIAFFALTAIAGFPLINITNSKILLVFFYPINSCANPFLYAILTSGFKKDLVHLFSRFGICTKCDREYRLIYSLPPANQQPTLTARLSTSHTRESI